MTATQLAEYKKIKAEPREARTGDRFLEKSGGLLRAGVPVKARYAYIHREEGNYPTRLMCHCLEVSHSGYYAWRNRGMSETQKRREELAIFVTYFFNDSKQTYGYRRVHKVLERNGVATSPETVRRLMRQEGLVACQPRPKARTTVPAADLAGRLDLIERNFTADAPTQKLVGDHHPYASHPGRIRVPGDRDGGLFMGCR